MDKENLFPLAEHIWLTLPEETRVSAVHTPGAIITGRLWGALDRYNVQILRWRLALLGCRCATSGHLSQLSRNRRQGVRLQEAMLGELTSLLVDTSPGSETAHGHRSPLQAAAAIVADSAGVRLDDSPAVVDDDVDDPLEAVDAVVAPSDIRTRRIQLSPGWERRDGPSFLGVASPEEPRPVAVVNSGRGAYRMIDPVSGRGGPGEPAAGRIARHAGCDVLPAACPQTWTVAWRHFSRPCAAGAGTSRAWPSWGPWAPSSLC